MGKYTSLARRVEETEPQERGETSTSNILNVNINNIYSNRDRCIDKPLSDRPKDTLQGSQPVDTAQGAASGSKVGVAEVDERATTVRPTTLTTLFSESEDVEEVWVAVSPDPHRYTNLARRERAAVQCIHRLNPDECAVCSGYVRWLIADEERFRRAQSNPEAMRREFWCLVRGGA